MKLLSLSLLLLLVASSCAFAEQEEQEEIVEYIAMVRIPNPDDVVALIRRGVSIDHPLRDHQTFEVYVTDKERAILDEYGFDYTIERNNAHMHASRDMSNGYHDYNALTEFMTDISTRYPTITRLFSLGKSVQNRDLWGIEITDNIGVKEAEPEFKYVANMHGDEVVGRELMIDLIDLLCSQYGVDDRITRLVNETDIYIVPTMNPDGYERRTRGNAHGVDLNRNFPDQFTSPLNTKTGREPEVVALMNFIEQHHFVLSINFHGGAVVANYPYDGNARSQSGVYSPAPDDEVFKFLAETYSQAHRTMHLSREFAGGITNGADWYVLYGGMQDWNYVYNQGVLELTVELSDNKWPAASTLTSFWNDNKEALLSYMELVHSLGIRGTVKSSSGHPLAATITVHNITRTTITNPEHGDYYRLLTAGTYTISASAPGYRSTSITITIPDDQEEQEVVDFILRSLSA